MKQVNQEEFNQFYEKNYLHNKPNWNKRECSVSWVYENNLKKTACKFIETDGTVQYYVDKD